MHILQESPIQIIYSFIIYFKNLQLHNRHLVVDTVLLYGVGIRAIVELLTELCALPVVDCLTATWATFIARCQTLDSGSDGVQRLVWWGRRTLNFTVVWFGVTKLAHLPWPRWPGCQDEIEEKADHNLETHVVLICRPRPLSLLHFKI